MPLAEPLHSSGVRETVSESPGGDAPSEKLSCAQHVRPSPVLQLRALKPGTGHLIIPMECMLTYCMVNKEAPLGTPSLTRGDRLRLQAAEEQSVTSV